MLALQNESSKLESPNTTAVADWAHLNNLQWLKTHFKKTIHFSMVIYLFSLGVEAIYVNSTFSEHIIINCLFGFYHHSFSSLDGLSKDQFDIV